jgi:hypothetical protein
MGSKIWGYGVKDGASRLSRNNADENIGCLRGKLLSKNFLWYTTDASVNSAIRRKFDGIPGKHTSIGLLTSPVLDLKWGGKMENSCLSEGKPQAVLPTCMSPAPSHRMYVSRTPPSAHPALKCIAVNDGQAVEPDAQYVADPFRIECVPISFGLIERRSSSSATSSSFTHRDNSFLNRSY